MKLDRFYVKNFRSLEEADIVLSDSTVLIGQNNEGKSNLLHALAVAMSIVRAHGSEYGLYDIERDLQYSWKRDFPLSKQAVSKGSKTTVFRLDISLESSEILRFKNSIGLSVNGVLPIEVAIDSAESPSFKAIKPGKGAASFERKSEEIARFIGDRLRIIYIPAVRTEQHCMGVINRVVDRELSRLEKIPEYKAALAKIAELQKPVLDQISQRVTESISGFLPQAKKASLKISSDRRHRAMRQSATLYIDDGTVTEIERKGDGIKSLAAIGLIHKFEEKISGVSLLAIEEPESHLHPGAIRKLKEVLDAISKNQQVIITTHNPVLANRIDFSSNIIVRNNHATPAGALSEIRDVLGVIPSDNLSSAEFALIVEGADDAEVIKSQISYRSASLFEALNNGSLIIEGAGGASKIPYLTSLYTASVCSVFVFVDNDEEGRKAIEECIDRNLFSDADYMVSRCPGMKNSEIEDCLNPELYRQALSDGFGVDVGSKDFRGSEKWSHRIRACFAAKNKIWGDRVKSKVKAVVAEMVVNNPEIALSDHKGTSLLDLIKELESRMKPRTPRTAGSSDS